MFAGEGPPEATNRRFHLPVPRAAGGAALDGLRQRDALRARIPTSVRTSSARSATRASPICTVDDAKKLYSGFDLCDADDLRLDDDQRSGADVARLLPERRHRSGGREAPARDGTPRGRVSRARASGRFRYAARCPRGTTGSASRCSVSPETRSWMPRPTRASVPMCSRGCAARSRPTS